MPSSDEKPAADEEPEIPETAAVGNEASPVAEVIKEEPKQETQTQPKMPEVVTNDPPKPVVETTAIDVPNGEMKPE